MTNKFLKAILLPPALRSQEELRAAIADPHEQLLDALEKRLKAQQPKPRHRPVQAKTLRTKEAAEYLGLSQWKLRQLVVTGEISVIRTTKYFLFAVDDLDAWIKRNREREVL